MEQIADKIEGKKVTDKIVSYYESHVRALPKGKVNNGAGMDRAYYDEQRIEQLESKYDIALAIPHKKRTDKPL